jgi:hypothetical protein
MRVSLRLLLVLTGFGWLVDRARSRASHPPGGPTYVLSRPGRACGHELKTPLTTIILSLQLQQRRDRQRASQPEERAPGENKGQEKPQSDVQLPLQQAERLNRPVNELLDTSRIQTGQVQLDQKPANLADIVRLSVEEQRQRIPERTLSLHLPAEPVPVLVDADRIWAGGDKLPHECPQILPGRSSGGGRSTHRGTAGAGLGTRSGAWIARGSAGAPLGALSSRARH